MAANLVVYGGTKFGKKKNVLVKREAKRLGYSSSAGFVWDAIRVVATGQFKKDLEAILTEENNGGSPTCRMRAFL